MADFVDPCCVASTMAVQLTKPDKNNNTTANVDDGLILPSEQCDVIEDGVEEKSNSTGDCDDRHVSSGADDDGTSNSTAAAPSMSMTDVQPIPISSSSSNNPNNNSSNNTSTHSSFPGPTHTHAPYKDFSGVDTESFISTTLRNNPKDRALLLNLETVLQQFILDEQQSSHQFQAMNSYERMIVHRVAAFFGLDHNVDKNGQAVVVTKTTNTRIPDFSFQKCIPEDESTDLNPGAFTTDASLSSNSTSNPTSTDIPARRILRRHEKTSNHEHSTRNGSNEEHSHPHSSSASSTTHKHSSTHKPYAERMNNYAETRARIFNESTSTNNNNDGSSSTTATNNTSHHYPNKTQKSNGRGNANYTRPSYRKSHPNTHSNPNRSYPYALSQTTPNNHLQSFATSKAIDPSSHLINPNAARAATIYSSHQMATPGLSMAQGPLYAPMVPSNPTAGPIRVSVPAPYFSQAQQQPMDYDYKQTLAGPHIYNYVPMIPPPASNFLHQPSQPTPQQQQQQQQQSSAHASASGQGQGLTSVSANNPNAGPSQHGTSIPLPILVHQQATGQIQYLFPAQALPQQQQGQQPPPPSATSYSLAPDGTYVQVYRPDGLALGGAGPGAVLENNPTHHHPHHHPYPPTPTYHHHPGAHPHPLSQPQQSANQPGAGPVTQAQGPGVTASQSNLANQPAPYLRLYPTATPANLSHPFSPATYPPNGPPPGTFVPPGALPPGSYMISPQTPGAVQPYSNFDNGTPYPTAYAPTNAGKNGLNNPAAAPPSSAAPSVQYATNHLSNLSLQSNPHDDYQTRLMNNNPNPRFTHPNGSTNNHTASTGAGGQPRNFIGRPLVQSPNGPSSTPRMTTYSTSNHSYRLARPHNLANTDKTVPAVTENDPKTVPSSNSTTTNTNTSESISLAGPAQE